MNKNLRKKALVPAIAMVIASVIALSGVTYAWFTTGNTANVETLDVNVQTANGIQVSLDAATWKSTLTGADITAAITGATAYSNRVIQFPSTEIAPVSSAGNVVDGKLQMFYGEYKADGTLRSEQEVEKNTAESGNFVAFDLFFKSGTAQDLTLKMGDTQSFVKWVNLANSNDVTNVGTDKAVRVAFLPLGSAATPAVARSLNTLTLDTGKALIWEPSATGRAPGVEAEGGKLPYSGFKAAFDGVAESALGASQVEAVTTFTDEQVIVKLQPGINKVRVYIWLEGQDVDCINNISFGDFAVNLAFSVPEVTE